MEDHDLSATREMKGYEMMIEAGFRAKTVARAAAGKGAQPRGQGTG